MRSDRFAMWSLTNIEDVALIATTTSTVFSNVDIRKHETTNVGVCTIDSRDFRNNTWMRQGERFNVA